MQSHLAAAKRMAGERLKHRRAAMFNNLAEGLACIFSHHAAAVCSYRYLIDAQFIGNLLVQ